MIVTLRHIRLTTTYLSFWAKIFFAFVSSFMFLTFFLTTGVLHLGITMYEKGSGMKLSNQNVLFISQCLTSYM